MVTTYKIQSISTGTSASGTIDHGNLFGIIDDDHTQYALLAGRDGGQTLYGSTVIGGGLTLVSTSDSTKGKILFGTSAYDEVNNRLGIGTTSPSAKLHVEGKTHIVGELVTVTDKNKTLTYISDDVSNVLIFQPEYWTGSEFAATSNYGLGHLTLENNSGVSSNGFGYAALKSNTGSYSNGFGALALYTNTANTCNGFGFAALQSNTGVGSNGFGHGALQFNTGVYSNAVGLEALSHNTATHANGFGYRALQFNSGLYANGFGVSALQNNIGDFANGFGGALVNNTGYISNAFGPGALGNNTGSYSNAFGHGALQYNQGNDNIAIGYYAGATFLSNTAGNKNFDYTDIDAGTDRITVTSHGFGATNAYVNLTYTEGTSPITGLINAYVYQVKIIDANTIGFYENSRGTNITAAGSGTGHTFTPQYTYDNTILIGANTVSTASNQVILGNDSVTQTLLKGDVGIGTSEPSAKLHVKGSTNAVQVRITANSTQTNPIITVFDGDDSSELIRMYPHIGANTGGTAYSLDTDKDIGTTIHTLWKNNGSSFASFKNENFGVGTLDPTQPISSNEKASMTATGGFAIKLTNKTGVASVAGQLVQASITADDAFAISGSASDDTMGVVLDAGVADGSEAWIVINGIAEVLMDSSGSARGDRIISSTTTSGSATVWNTGGVVAEHFQEIGHCIETVSGVGLARCVIHFN